MDDLIARRKVVQDALVNIDETAYWFTQNRHFLTDEIGVMLEMTISRLQALDSAIMIKLRQMAEEKLAAAMVNKMKSRERISNVRKQIETKPTAKPKPVGKSKPAAKPASRTKPASKTKPSARLPKDGARGTKAAKAKR